MRIAIVCRDTRGGVQPYVALGRGLRAAGHEVWAVAPADFVGLFGQYDIRAVGLDGEAEAMPQAGLAEQGSLRTIAYVAGQLPRILARWTEQTLAACEGADVLTGGVGGMVVGLSVADRLHKPFIQTHLQPLAVRSQHYPGVMLGGLPQWLGPMAREASHVLSDAAIWMPFKPAIARVRSETLGLHGRSTASAGRPVLYGISPRVVEIASDARATRIATGYWMLHGAADWRPPPDLAAFLARPGPVISVGFGSMTAADPGELGELVAAAVRQAGVRAVVLSGWQSLAIGSQNTDLFVARDIPHDWLFPRVAAVVHHGGAGTTAAALSAGVPSIVVPFTMDQPFWGQRTHALGVGPLPLPRRQLTVAGLAKAITIAVTDTEMQRRASALGRQLQAEDGVATAVALFERAVG